MFSIFDKFGGEEAAIEALRKSDLGPRQGWPSVHAIKFWRAKGELPGTAIKALMRLCDERGIEYTTKDFVAK